MPSTDEELVARSMGGDLDSFNQLVLRWERPIYALAYRVIGREEDARDVAQETFLRAFRALKGFKGQAKFSSWLYRITLNLCRDWIRRERRDPGRRRPPKASTSSSWPAKPRPSESIEDMVSRHELGRAVGKAMAPLPEEQRTAIILKEYHGLTFQEIAELLDCPLSTVKTRLYQGLTRAPQAAAGGRSGEHVRQVAAAAPTGKLRSDRTYTMCDSKELLVSFLYDELDGAREAGVRGAPRCPARSAATNSPACAPRSALRSGRRPSPTLASASCATQPPLPPAAAPRIRRPALGACRGGRARAGGGRRDGERRGAIRRRRDWSCAPAGAVRSRAAVAARRRAGGRHAGRLEAAGGGARTAGARSSKPSARHAASRPRTRRRLADAEVLRRVQRAGRPERERGSSALLAARIAQLTRDIDARAADRSRRSSTRD